MRVEVLYRDEHLVAVVKPANLLSQPDQSGEPDLLSLLRRQLTEGRNSDDPPFLGLIHRLDRQVSGVMVFALSRVAAAHLAGQFRQRTVTKHYMAILSGCLKIGGEWRDHVAMGRKARIVAAQDPKAKLAVMHTRVLAHEPGSTLVDIVLKTGRAHQIRIQSASRGFAIAGDRRYRSELPFPEESLALHAWLLAIVHPVSGAALCWRLPPPTTWDGRYQSARKALLENRQAEDDETLIGSTQS